MSRNSHTPGPWFWENNALCNKDFIVGGSGHAFHNQANRSLLAAAPELLEALIEARVWVQGWNAAHESEESEKALIMCNKAIARALGQ